MALSLTVLGCSGRVSFEAPGESSGDDRHDGVPVGTGAESGAERTDVPGEGEEVKLFACDAPEAGTAVEVDLEQVSCCKELLAPRVPSVQNDWDYQRWSGHESDPDVQACCGVVLADESGFNRFDGIIWEMSSACCSALDWSGHVGCTP